MKAQTIASSNPTDVHAALVSRVSDVLTHYRNDLLVHDLRAITENPSRSFLQVTYDTGTHLYFMPTAGENLNEVVPIGFGRGSIRNYYRQIRDLLRTHAFANSVVYTAYDASTGRMRTIDKGKAADEYAEALRKAEH